MSLEAIVAQDADTIRAIASQTGAFDKFATNTVKRFGRKKMYVVGAQNNDAFVGRVNLQVPPADEAVLREACPDSTILIGLHVNSDFRRRGVAGLLMQAAEDYSVELGFSSCCLGVEENNAPARQLYEKRGYAYMDVTYLACWDEPDDQNGLKRVCVDAMLMRKTLK